MKKKKLFGSLTPYAWSLEITHGCNIRCGHCNCRLDPLPKTYHFMSVETAKKAAKIISAVNETSRLDLCGGGEMTMNPDIVEIVRVIRSYAPKLQIQLTTNGTMFTNGKLTYGELLDAGVNFIYTDMYAPKEKHRALADDGKTFIYEYYDAPDGAPSPWTYHGDPSLRVVVLQKNPSDWPKTRQNANLLGTWFNHLDWDSAAQFGLTPVFEPPSRRCNQPFIYSVIDAWGNYLVCGQDSAGETSGQLGNVESGIEGYKEYWFSPFMQMVRRNLRNKDRVANPHCCRCSVTFSRCDYKHWKRSNYDYWWKGGQWHKLTDGDAATYRSKVQELQSSIGGDGLPTKPWDGFPVELPESS